LIPNYFESGEEDNSRNIGAMQSSYLGTQKKMEIVPNQYMQQYNKTFNHYNRQKQQRFVDGY
jgi:hypothetical protein